VLTRHRTSCPLHDAFTQRKSFRLLNLLGVARFCPVGWDTQHSTQYTHNCTQICVFVWGLVVPTLVVWALREQREGTRGGCRFVRQTPISAVEVRATRVGGVIWRWALLAVACSVDGLKHVHQHDNAHQLRNHIQNGSKTLNRM
jgi:hypothetical protein